LPGLGLDLEERECVEDIVVNEANGLFGEDLGGKTTAISIAESKYLD
jgi:hypothetical protein